MSTERKPGFVRISLTAEQKAQVLVETGKEADAVELSVRELEERIAPLTCTSGRHFPDAT